MIIVKLKGGIGNQMFQYALGRNLALKNNTRLKLDIGDFKKDKLRNYGLDNLNISADTFNISANLIFELGLTFLRIFSKISHNNYLRIKNYLYIREKDLYFDRNILAVKGNIYLYGHWQCEKYFRDINNIIVKDFKIKTKPNKRNQLLLEKIKNSNSVCLHIRRSDYIENPRVRQAHGVCSLKYYYNSIKEIEKKIKNPAFFVFSDDIKWAKKNLRIDYSCVFVDINNPEKAYEDLRLMSNCKHFIIANSSFSWWGAWLSNNPNKIIYAPERWFAQKDEGDIIPKSWVKVNG